MGEKYTSLLIDKISHDLETLQLCLIYLLLTLELTAEQKNVAKKLKISIIDQKKDNF